MINGIMYNIVNIIVYIYTYVVMSMHYYYCEYHCLKLNKKSEFKEGCRKSPSLR